MYKYDTCGLSTIWLNNGYQEIETDYGIAVSIEDLEGLHQAIGCDIVHHSPSLTGEEFRFLRKELSMSQKKLSFILGNDEQSVAGWEKKSRVPKWADTFVRKLYLEYVGSNEKIIDLIDRINDIDASEYKKAKHFEEVDKVWQSKAA